MAHTQEVLADDVEPSVRQQVMDVRNAPRDRVLDRDHAVSGLAALHGSQRVLERRARQGLEIGVHLTTGEMGVGARLSLIGYAQRYRTTGLRVARALRLGSAGGLLGFSVGHGGLWRARAMARLNSSQELAGALKIGRSIDT